ncbi:hypothetical protein GCM10023324_36610 [Streptomyces youssoufiensis]
MVAAPRHRVMPTAVAQRRTDRRGRRRLGDWFMRVSLRGGGAAAGPYSGLAGPRGGVPDRRAGARRHGDSAERRAWGPPPGRGATRGAGVPDLGRGRGCRRERGIPRWVCADGGAGARRSGAGARRQARGETGWWPGAARASGPAGPRGGVLVERVERGRAWGVVGAGRAAWCRAVVGRSWGVGAVRGGAGVPVGW